MAKPASSSPPKSTTPNNKNNTGIESEPAEGPKSILDRTTSHDNTESETGDEPESEAEAEVLSHAAQRKAKKRKLKEAQRIDHSEATVPNRATKPQSKQDQPELPARQNSVWVGNLSFKTTEVQLKQFFAEAGEVSRIHMPKKLEVGQGRGMRGENRGFAYVDFTTAEGQITAIKFSEKNLDGRRLLIKKGDDFAGRPNAPKTEVGSGDQQEAKAPTVKSTLNTHSKTAQKILAAQKQPAAQTLFMGNLPFETKEDDIREMIEGHGLPSDLEEQAKEVTAKNPGGKPQRWLKKIRMGTFEDSGLCKGWAFLDFLNTAYATAVLVNPRNHHLNGRKLVLEYGSPDAVRRGGGGPRPSKRQIEKEEPKETARAAKKRKFTEANEESDATGEEATKSPQKPKPKGDEQYIRAKDGRLRPKPGAALAMAKKEVVAIVPSTGKRTVF